MWAGLVATVTHKPAVEFVLAYMVGSRSLLQATMAQRLQAYNFFCLTLGSLRLLKHSNAQSCMDLLAVKFCGGLVLFR